MQRLLRCCDFPREARTTKRTPQITQPCNVQKLQHANSYLFLNISNLRERAPSPGVSPKRCIPGTKPAGPRTLRAGAQRRCEPQPVLGTGGGCGFTQRTRVGPQRCASSEISETSECCSAVKAAFFSPPSPLGPEQAMLVARQAHRLHLCVWEMLSTAGYDRQVFVKRRVLSHSNFCLLANDRGISKILKS